MSSLAVEPRTTARLSSAPTYVTSCRVDYPGVSIAMMDLTWPHAESGLTLHDHHLVEMTLSRRPPRAWTRNSDESSMVGNLVFIPAGHPVDLEWEAGSKRSICCFIDPALAPGLSALERDTPSNWLDVRSGFSLAAMTRLARELVSPGPATGQLAESICKAMLFDLFNLAPQQDRVAGPRLDLSRIDAILDLDGPPPTLAELSVLCGVSVRHFTRMFRDATGAPFSAYAQGRRIERAKSLLIGPMRIKEIAWKCGFQEATAFSTAFRRQVGMPPKEYRLVNQHEG